MKYVLNTVKMQACDANTMNGYGVISPILMERAALSAASEITAMCPDPSSGVLIACGVGNNGGDGLAMARLLYLKGYRVTVLFPGNEEKCSEECARQLGIVRKYGIDIVRETPDEDYDVIVDAIFGIGLSREIGGIWFGIICDLNRRNALKVAVDIPSGISADTGKVMGIAFRADLTATFGFAKSGQLLFPGAGFCGKLIVEDMGIDEKSLMDIRPDIRMAQPEDLDLLPKRMENSNKGNYGKVLIFAGSFNMAGAAAFSAGAAYRTGAGLVRIATDIENRTILQTLVPEALMATYDEMTDMEVFAAEQIDWADAVVLGPGIGQSRQAEEMVHAVLKRAKGSLLIDADGLNILSRNPGWLEESEADIVITPHPGEMARLTGATVAEVKDDLIGTAKRFSEEHDVITVLKDARTVICGPDGIWINTTGNNGMATGGSGDVLSGVIGALLGQNVPAERAAVLGVLLHGMAGDRAAEKVGKISMMASDIIDGLSIVLKEI